MHVRALSKSACITQIARFGNNPCDQADGFVVDQNGGYTRVTPTWAGYRVSPDSGAVSAPSAEYGFLSMDRNSGVAVHRTPHYGWPR